MCATAYGRYDTATAHLKLIVLHKNFLIIFDYQPQTLILTLTTKPLMLFLLKQNFTFCNHLRGVVAIRLVSGIQWLPNEDKPTLINRIDKQLQVFLCNMERISFVFNCRVQV